jgi:UDP-glucuronate 4-epimerase
MPTLRHLIYASSSSVYGDRRDGPFRETDCCDKPASIYAATKLAGEMLSTAYASLYGLSVTGLRFFTVYGPFGRPDMAYWTFAQAIFWGAPVTLYNEGRMRRDFTDVRDVVGGLIRICEGPAAPGHEIYNIGCSEPVELTRFVAALEAAIGRPAAIEHAPMQPGDVGDTYADVSKLEAAYGYRPRISIEEGMAHFVGWYRHWRDG